MCIVTDNGHPLIKKQEVTKLCDKYHIQPCFTTPYYPQRNGQVGATNKTFLKILEKVVNEAE